MTITEKLSLMDTIERRNDERIACMKPLEVSGLWRKTCKYGHTYEVRIAYDDFDKCLARGITIDSMVAWSIEDALWKLNQRLEPWNIKVTSLTKSALSA